MDLTVLYEDNHLLVVNKPRNMPVCLDSSQDLDLLTAAKAYLKEKYQKPGDVYLGLVHRLDRPVGGLVVFARTSKAASRLGEQLQSRTLHRTYLAVVRGTPERRGRLEHYLLKDAEQNTVYVVPRTTEGAKQAILDYETLQTAETAEGVLSLCRVTLQTGRSHQIRAQFAHIGHPLYGDQRYGPAGKRAPLSLYAIGLTFTHPTKEQQLRFSSNPPAEFPFTQFTARNWQE